MNLASLKIRWLAVWVLGLTYAATETPASPYSDLVVFGDSLSDLGNTSAATFGLQPGAGYFSGRFSNGPVYAEHLSTGLGLGTLARSGTGGTGYAYGGAETNGPDGFTGVFIKSLVEQVDLFLNRVGSGADPAALYVVFIGANDLLGGQTNVNQPVGTVLAQMSRLVNAGARQFLGINLPLLGLTPDYNTNATLAAAISATTADYNAALATAYDSLQAATAGVIVHELDLQSLFSQLVATPAQWGFTNVTGRGQNVASGLNAPGYIFWDGVHPTREAHALLADAAIRAVLPTGDYNRDGVVTEADYFVWRDGYGTAFSATLGQTSGLQADGNGDGRIDVEDYTLWRDALNSASRSVPEPTAWALASLLAMLGGTRSPRTARPIC
ncbi:SGNH/GDSL hydrolase family protein [Botrimarina hoheduenensis]|nr:SGNH/GDSL hydrolase family protein [Botrimarina hoheduenensis]